MRVMKQSDSEMKKNIYFSILTLLCLVTAWPVCAQTHYKSRLYAGVHGGVDLSRVTFTPSVKQKFILGGNAGVNFRYIEEKHFGFIVEVNWEQRGWKENFEELPYNYSRTVNYVQIPFMSHIYFGSRGKFFINLGPSVSFKISDSMKSNFDPATASQNPDFSNRNLAQLTMPIKQKVDYGISGGIGGEFSINPKNSIYLDARFYYGLGNLVQSGRSDAVRGSNVMTISISAGYWFRFK